VKKIYADDRWYSIKYPKLVKYVKDVYDLREKDKQKYDDELIILCNTIRKILKLDKLLLLGIVTHPDTNEKFVCVSTFDHPADDVTYSRHFDEEKQKNYIEVED
jgi:hypothetical protein